MRAVVHRGMLALADRGGKKEAERVSKGLDWLVRWHRRKGLDLREAKMRAQLSWNHEHMPSRVSAQRLAGEVSDAFHRDHPKLANRLAVDWREGHPREKGNVVTLSFWLDMPKHVSGAKHISANEKFNLAHFGAEGGR